MVRTHRWRYSSCLLYDMDSHKFIYLCSFDKIITNRIHKLASSQHCFSLFCFALFQHLSVFHWKKTSQAVKRNKNTKRNKKKDLTAKVISVLLCTYCIHMRNEIFIMTFARRSLMIVLLLHLLFLFVPIFAIFVALCHWFKKIEFP